MHASTRILLVVVALVAIGGGWWFLFAANDAVPAIIYSVLWTVGVLVVARVLLAIGLGYNRLTAARRQDPEPKPADALAKLKDLRDRELISADEYEAKRAKILEQL